MRLQTMLFALAAVTTSALSARAQAVRIVNQPGLGTFPTLQAAIDVATKGDVLLVAAGTYPAFTIDNKSLWIEAIQPGTVNVSGTIRIDNVPQKSLVVLVGINATGATASNVSDPGLRASNNKGQLRFDRCQFTGGRGSGTPPPFGLGPYGAGGDGATFTSCANVMLLATTALGGVGGSTSQILTAVGGVGGEGVRAEASRLVCYDTSCIGGQGGKAGYTGGRGGNGYRALAGFGLFAENTRYEGGRGGDAFDFISAFGGDGGRGMILDTTTARAQAFGCVLAGGAGGIGLSSHGQPGAQSGGLGAFQFQPLVPRKCTALPITSDATNLTVTVSGEQGDRAFLLVGTTIGFSASQSLTGVLLVDETAPLAPMPLGIIDGSGVLTASLALPDLLGPSRAQVAVAQLLVVTLQGAYVIGSPMNLVVLDRAAQPDCDGNAVLDYLDMIEVPTSDCHRDLVLDRCQLTSGASQDCNSNGLPDECDLASGTSHDVNHNQVPDECEVFSGGPDWYVDAGAPAGGNGSAAMPFQNIWQAVLSAQSGHRIRIADGVYTGTGNRAIEFGGKNLIIESLNGPSHCVVDCQGQGRAFRIFAPVTTARIEGLTIRNGRESYAGAVLVQNWFPIGIDFTLRNCVVESCTTTGGLGGGGGRLEGNITVQDCVFRGNNATGALAAGGGLVVDVNGSCSVLRCIFESNTAASTGGGLWLPGAGSATVSHCVFRGNVATANVGGALHAGLNTGTPPVAPLVLTHSSFAGNRGSAGGAIYANGPIDLSNCTITGNTATTAGGGVQAFRSTNLRNCIVWGNSAPTGTQLSTSSNFGVLGVDRCDVAGDQAGVFVNPGSTLVWGAGNLALDPLFVDADGADNNPATLGDNDYRLSAFSPCVDAGDNSFVLADELDLDGDGDVLEQIPLDLALLSRFYDQPSVPDTGVGSAPIIDLGCYEQQP